MVTMKTIPPNEYVALINQLNGKALPGRNEGFVTFTLLGKSLEQRTHLHIPPSLIVASKLSIIELRKEGIFCFPVLAPFDQQVVRRTYRSGNLVKISAELR